MPSIKNLNLYVGFCKKYCLICFLKELEEFISFNVDMFNIVCPLISFMQFERVSRVMLMDLIIRDKEMIKFFRQIFKMVISKHKHGS